MGGTYRHGSVILAMIFQNQKLPSVLRINLHKTDEDGSLYGSTQWTWPGVPTCATSPVSWCAHTRLKPDAVMRHENRHIPAQSRSAGSCFAPRITPDANEESKTHPHPIRSPSHLFCGKRPSQHPDDEPALETRLNSLKSAWAHRFESAPTTVCPLFIYLRKSLVRRSPPKPV